MAMCTMTHRMGIIVSVLTTIIMIFLYMNMKWYELNLQRYQEPMLLPLYEHNRYTPVTRNTMITSPNPFQKLGTELNNRTKPMKTMFQERNENFTSRLFFHRSFTEYWIPSSNITLDVNFSVDSRFLKPVNTGNTSMLIVLVNPPIWLRRKISNESMASCRYSNCLISLNKSKISVADAVVYDAKGLPRTQPPRPAGQPWIIYNWESHTRTPTTMGSPKWRGVFNWIMSYTNDSDIFSPVGMFLPTKKPSSYQHLLNIVQKKTKTAVWFVSNCKTPSKRSQYVKQLQKVIDVDIFGKCGTQLCPKNQSECHQKLNHTYKFYLSFENSLCKDYITEKLYKTFDVPCVPAVRGGADYKNLVPRGTYINTADFGSAEDLGKYLKHLSNNISAYMDIIMRKEQYRTLNSTSSQQMGFCELCYRLNNPDVKGHIHKDVGEWHRNGNCQVPSDLKSS